MVDNEIVVVRRPKQTVGYCTVRVRQTLTDDVTAPCFLPVTSDKKGYLMHCDFDVIVTESLRLIDNVCVKRHPECGKYHLESHSHLNLHLVILG